jgi:hypothetical protein
VQANLSESGKSIADEVIELFSSRQILFFRLSVFASFEISFSTSPLAFNSHLAGGGTIEVLFYE